MSDDAPKPSRTAGREGTLGPQRIALTRREREILGMLADGLSGAQIAARLSLSPETVRTHVRNAMAKLGASTRSQAVALALQSREIAGDSQAATTAPAPAHRREAAPATTAALTPDARRAGRALRRRGRRGLPSRRGRPCASPRKHRGGGQRVQPRRQRRARRRALGRAALDRRAQLLQIRAPHRRAGR